MGNIGEIKKEVGLNCLHCGQSQLPPTRAKLDSWTCGYCYSGFVSLAMLTNLLPRELVGKIGKKVEFPRWGRACPKCHEPMQISMVAEGDSRVDFDICHGCRLLWFDAGRIVKLLRLRDPEQLAAKFAEAAKFVRPDEPFEPRGIHAKPKAEAPTSTRKLRPGYLLKLFLLSWLTGHFFMFVSQSRAGVGFEFGVLGLAAYFLCRIPYREMLFPKERWRSNFNTIMGTLVFGLGLVIIVMVWDFFQHSFRRVASGGVGGELSGTLFGTFTAFVGSGLFFAYLAVLALGIVWYVNED